MSIKTKVIFTCLLCVLLLPAQSLFAQQTNNERIDSLFASLQNKPGCAVGVVYKGKVIHSKGYGMANLEYTIPITPTTPFDIASVSKQFTGYAIAKLIEQGKLSEKDAVRKYLPEVPDFGQPITVYHLLHHTSGLRDWPATLHAGGWRYSDLFTFEDIMRMVHDQKELSFEPGTQYSYSNTGYNLLALIVERVSGKLFSRYMKEEVFQPVGMKNTLVMDDPGLIIQGMAYGYEPRDSGFVKNTGTLSAPGSSSMATDITDLVRWSQFFNGLLKEKDPVALRMIQPGFTNKGDTVTYGYGLGLRFTPGNRRIVHTGGWGAYQSILAHYPDDELTIILLTNNSAVDLSSYSNNILAIVLNKPMTPTVSQQAIRLLPDVSPDTVVLKQRAGSYQLDQNWIVTLSYVEGKLFAHTNGEGTYPVRAKSDTSFVVDAYPHPLFFVKVKGDTLPVVQYRDIVSKRISIWDPTASELRKYGGIFYSEELHSEMEVTWVDGKLSMTQFRLGTFELQPEFKQHRFSTVEYDFEFVVDKKGIVTALLVSTSRNKNIRFERRK